MLRPKYVAPPFGLDRLARASDEGQLVKLEIRRTGNGQYYWRIVAGNGQVLAHSETYGAKQSAINAAQLVKLHAGAAPIHDYAT